MKWSIFEIFRRVLTSAVRPAKTKRKVPARRWRPTLEVLEDRCVPTTITSTFTNTAVASGNSIWFSSAAGSITGVGTSPATIHVTNQTISFTDSYAGTINMSLPDADLTVTPGGSSATTTYNTTLDKWFTNAPTGLPGNEFLSAAGLALPSGLHGGDTVTWTATFSTDTSGLSFKWSWAAAAYSGSASDYNSVYGSLGVKPCDSSTASSYHTTDKAGTPENYKTNVTAGAKGGGGFNYVGSYTPTTTVSPSFTATYVTLAGTVYVDANQNGALDSGEAGISGVTLTLTGTTAGGQSVTSTTTTASDGSYSFTMDSNGNNLVAGTYQIAETQPAGYYQGSNTVGNVSGQTSADGTLVPTDQIGTIVLTAGQNSVGNNFGEISPYTQETNAYPYSSSNSLTNVAFNESQVLAGASVNVANGTFDIFYSDEHALALGFDEVDSKFTGSTVNGSKTVSVTTTGLSVGVAVSGTGIPTGTTITAIGATTVTLSNAATATGSTTLTFATTYSVSPLNSDPSSVTNPAVGATATTGPQAGVDASGRSLFPSLYLTDITANANSTSGDWQNGGTAIAPTALYGSWKAFTKTVDYSTSSPITKVSLSSNVATLTAANSFTSGQTVVITGLSNTLFNGTFTITSANSTSFSFALTGANVATTSDSGRAGVVTTTADADPTANGWSLGSGADPVPSGLSDAGYGTEIVWSTSSLYNSGLLIPGHNYRFYFIVHDGDQNKVGGDCGQATYDFTYRGPVTIAGNVYKDVYGNGVDGAGDTGIGGVTLSLSGTSATGQPVTASTTTAADGTYTFTTDSNGNLLHGGTYSITETPPSGYLPGIDTVGMVDWSTGYTTAMGNYLTDAVNSSSDNILGASALDTVGLSQWAKTTGKPAATDDIENAFGINFADSLTGHNFLLTGLDRYANTANTNVGFWAFQNPVSVNANGTFSGVHTAGDLFIVANVSVNGATSISVYEWTGTDASGGLTLVTPPVGATNLFVNTTPASVPWSFTDSAGKTSPQAGELVEAGVDLNAIYGLTVPHFASFLTETRASTATNATLSDFAVGNLTSVNGSFTADGTLVPSYQIGSIVINDGQNGINYNFGEVQPVTVSGLVYHDINGNGVYDNGDAGISGVSLTLTGTNNVGQAVTATTTTAADGTYSFTVDNTGKLLAPGTYQIVETEPSGYIPGTTAVGTVNGTVVGTVVADGTIGSITETTGENGINYDFGEVKAVTLSGTVYLDTNGNGVRNTGEPGVQGVTVTLSGTNGLGQPITATAQTDANGNYSFTLDSNNNPLRPGTSYQITETLPTGYVVTSTAVGTVNSVADGSVGSAGTIGSIGLTSGQSGVNYNFGDVNPVTVSGLVYVDTNGNNAQDLGESGLAGVTLTLSGTNGLGQSITATATSAADGTFSFTKDSNNNLLLPGTSYKIVETQPTGYLLGAATVGTVSSVADGTASSGTTISSIALTSGQSGIDYKFGDLQAVTIGGTVYQDMNVNGVMDSGEPGISGVTLTLNGTNGLNQAITATTTTAADGTYSFTVDSHGNALRPGTYQITETQPSNYLVGGTSVGTVNNLTDGSVVSNGVIGSIVVTSGQAGINYNFGAVKPVTVSGTVYEDQNRNGVLDTGEPGIAGVTLTLSGTNDQNQSITATTTTGSDGTYSFTVDSNNNLLRPGTYQIAETQPTGYFQGTNTVGTVNGTTDGTLIPVDQIGNIALTSSQNGVNYNFGEIKPVMISGTVYYDANANGVYDAGDTGISGVTVTLTGTTVNNQSVSLTTTTDGNGNYSFITDSDGTPLWAGTYQVAETQPSGYLQGVNAVGTVNGTTDGTLIPTDKIGNIAFSAGQTGINYNFGEVTAVTIAGTAYIDANIDEVLDNGESGLAGVPVTLSGTNILGQSVTASATTAADGTYKFMTDSNNNVLWPGTYQVSAGTPSGYALDAANVGTVNGVTDGKASLLNTISSITLNSFANGVQYNFGLVVASAIAGYVYVDGDRDQVFDNSDTGVSNQTIEVVGTDMFGDSVDVTTTTNNDGFYIFAALLPGTYSVFFTPSGGAFFTEVANVGTINGNEVGVANGTTEIDTVVVGSGVSAVSYNFGLTQPIG